jgi:hypothetical protein
MCCLIQGCAITIARRPGLPNFEVGRANITAAIGYSIELEKFSVVLFYQSVIFLQFIFYKAILQLVLFFS